GTDATFTNNGTYTNSGSYTGTTNIDVPFINNNGTVESAAGTLNFRSSFTTSGGGVLLTPVLSQPLPTVQFSAPVSLVSTALAGTGTVNASSVTAGLLVSPGNSLG